MEADKQEAEPVRIEHSLLHVGRAAAALVDAMRAMQAAPIEFSANDPFVMICAAARAACLQVMDYEGDRPHNEAVARRLYQERDLADTLPPLFVLDE